MHTLPTGCLFKTSSSSSSSVLLLSSFLFLPAHKSSRLSQSSLALLLADDLGVTGPWPVKQESTQFSPLNSESSIETPLPTKAFQMLKGSFNLDPMRTTFKNERQSNHLVDLFIITINTGNAIRKEKKKRERRRTCLCRQEWETAYSVQNTHSLLDHISTRSTCPDPSGNKWLFLFPILHSMECNNFWKMSCRYQCNSVLTHVSCQHAPPFLLDSLFI